MKREELLKRFDELTEESYGEFTRKLIPNQTKLCGIRLPNLRKLAKQIAKEDKASIEAYMNEVQFQSYEETTLLGMVIGLLSLKKFSFEEIEKRIQLFVPQMDNWSTCDSFCTSLKLTKNEPNKLYQLASSFAKSNREYEIRFYLVMCINYFITDNYIDSIMQTIDDIQHRLNDMEEMYYVNMAIAWLNSMIYVKYPERILTWLNTNKNKLTTEIDYFIHNKTISKITESLQVTKEEKDIVRKLRVYHA